ncbi:MAG: alanine racemase [Micavibrio aeruginosavorus]|uniref:Alanine racemase n=1 Tax=Micavibrio aeruginosavorus TaxID=349221 RepID=A0A7T5R2W8_9BACT|nr:MAG: alanine racemase [Micavibrio aeruginosavorus]
MFLRQIQTAAPIDKSINSAAVLGRLTIDLGAIAANHDVLSRQVGPECKLAGVVKANSYGIGMDKAAPVLFGRGSRRFFVATPEEALTLRRILPLAEIAVLGGGLPEAADEYIAHQIEPVLNSLHDIALWRDGARRSGKILPAIIHLDTGMNRLGLSESEAAMLIQDPALVRGLDVILVMSHFACADEKYHPLTQSQYERFSLFARHFPRAQKSLANSSGIFRHSDYHFDLVRPGMAIYGLNPTPETSNPMHPVVALDARILQTRTLKKGESIGYSATHIFTSPALTATVALGYADGFHRANGGKARLYWRGIPCPVVGRVSMDLVTVDLSHLKDSLPQPGDWLEVLGPHQSADQLAKSADTIGYEVLTNLGARYQRIYRDAV